MNIPKIITCVACGVKTPTASESDDFPEACPDCEDRLPASLIKACYDYFDYALSLRTGETIRFSEAKICGKWVHLTINADLDSNDSNGSGFSLDRGLDVRLSDIVWCADAPNGS